jgi:4-amino-4-deoxy-L-arabinose transferase-like glycosyltransferase
MSMRLRLAAPPIAEAAVLGLALVLFATALGRDALRDWDEATNACVVREMAASGDWLSPRLDGEPFREKPPLLLWLVGLSFHGLGESELAARLPVALFGVGGVLAALLAARRLGGRTAGLLAALLLTTAPQWLRFSRQLMFDVPLATASTFALLGVLEGSVWLTGLGVGAALMIKGVAAWVLPVTLLAALALPGAPHRDIAAGVGLGVGIAAPWHVVELVVQGRPFLTGFIGANLVQRALTAVEGHAAAWWYYLDRIFVRWVDPWHWIGAVAVVSITYRAFRGRAGFGEKLLVVWFWAVLAAFSLARTKLAWYVMPVYPTLAALTAVWLAPRVERSRWARGLVAGLAVLTVSWSVVEVTSGRLANPAADATRAVLHELPPASAVPVLLVASPVPLEAARYYSGRVVRRISSPSEAPAGTWVLADPAGQPPSASLRPVARLGPRILLGP